MDFSNPAVTVPAAPATITWIHQPAELDQWLKAGQEHPLALDTEFERVNTFHPIPGLIQLGLDGDLRLTDPSVAEASEEFRKRLADPESPKLLYAMSEDLELFRHWLSLEPAGVLDLQVGAALAGAGFSVGYARLVETLFGETLDKSATRSDWLQRPLTEAQQRYALDDVRFLVPLYHWVCNRLAERDLLDALQEESDRFANELAQQDDLGNYYLKLRGGWTLPPEKQAILQALASWREQECRRRDRPRNRVLPDNTLIAIAEQAPRTIQALARISDVPPVVVRRYGEALVAIIAETDTSDAASLATIIPPLTRSEQQTYKQLKRVLVNLAENTDIPVELLAPRRRLEAVVRQRSLKAGRFNEGWRWRLVEPVQEQLEDILHHD